MMAIRTKNTASRIQQEMGQKGSTMKICQSYVWKEDNALFTLVNAVVRYIDVNPGLHG